jgi:hypothetical protein
LNEKARPKKPKLYATAQPPEQAPEPVEHEAGQQQKCHQQAEKHQRRSQHGPQAAEHHAFLAKRGQPVGERLGRGVDRQPAAGLGEMRAGGDRAADQASRNHPRRINITQRKSRQQGTGRNANEGLETVPERIEGRNLVGDQLGESQDAGDRADHQRVLQHRPAWSGRCRITEIRSVRQPERPPDRAASPLAQARPADRAGASNFPQMQSGSEMVGIIGSGFEFSGQAD